MEIGMFVVIYISMVLFADFLEFSGDEYIKTVYGSTGN